MLSSHFGSHLKNRVGFQKQIRELADKAWNSAIDIIKHITERGGKHDFRAREDSTNKPKTKVNLNMNELNAISYSLETEKNLSLIAHSIHRQYNHPNPKHAAHYDAEVSENENVF